MSEAGGLARGEPSEHARVPEWLRPLAARARQLHWDELGRFTPAAGGRQSAVLVLFGTGMHPSDGGVAELPDVLLIERAHTLRRHAGQPAFPGGRVDPDDAGPEAAALREAVEETGLDPAGVEVFATLPPLGVPPNNFVVTPVLAYWRSPSAVAPVDAAEVAAVVRVPIAELVDPTNRYRVRHPSGYVGPAFAVRSLVVWGFTAGLLDRLLRLGGFERPWNPERYLDVPRPVGPR